MKREREIAVEKGYFYEGVRYLTVAVSKRSHKHRYNVTGMAIISSKILKLVSFNFILMITSNLKFV